MNSIYDIHTFIIFTLNKSVKENRRYNFFYNIFDLEYLSSYSQILITVRPKINIHDRLS